MVETGKPDRLESSDIFMCLAVCLIMVIIVINKVSNLFKFNYPYCALLLACKLDIGPLYSRFHNLNYIINNSFLSSTL